MTFSMDLSEKRPDFHPNSRTVENELERLSLVPLDFVLRIDDILKNIDTSDPIEPLRIINEGCFREIAVHSNRRNVEIDSISIKCYRLATKR